MNNNDLITLLITISILVLPTLTAFLVKLIQTKTAAIEKQTNNAEANKYIDIISDTITSVVTALNQTTVDSLKANNGGKLTDEQIKMLKSTALSSVLTILGEKAKAILTDVYGDLNELITTKVDAEVKKQKDATK